MCVHVRERKRLFQKGWLCESALNAVICVVIVGITAVNHVCYAHCHFKREVLVAPNYSHWLHKGQIKLTIASVSTWTRTHDVL